MAQSAIEIARAATAAYRTLEGFEATQTLSAGSIRAEARVRYRRPGKITAEYHTYQDPLGEFEERLTGAPEFVSDELIGMQLVYDGYGTWLYDPRSNVALHKSGRALYAPLHGMHVLAELGFLRDLTHDFLLRDEGEETIAGRPTRRLGLKPKAPHRTFLLKEELFPVQRATVAFDAETSFPLRITYTPSHDSVLYYLVGPSTPITVEYADVRIGEVADERFSFTPPEETRVFREEQLLRDALTERLPFAVPLEALERRGVTFYGDRAVVTLDEAAERGYALFTLVPPKSEGEDPGPQVLSLRVGNYLSRNMSRRRATLAEHGESLELGGLKARFLDRSARIKDDLPEIAERRVMEVAWEDGGVFGFLLGEGLTKEALLELAGLLAQSGGAAC